MANSFEAVNLVKRYEGFQLGPISLHLPEGCIMGLVGENGAGKTTLIKLLTGIVKKDGGQVRLLGRTVEADAPSVREDIGVVFDESSFPFSFRGRDVDTVLKRIYRQWDSALYRQYLDRLQLPMDKPVKDFSRGMKMKLQIAAALAHRPRLLLLDEPTGGLDPIVRDEILDVFLDFIADEGHSILLSSHITSDLEKVADYIVFIHEGQIVFELPKDEMLEKFAVVKCARGGQSALAAAHILGVQESRFDTQVLVDNAPEVRRANPGAVLEAARIDDIMTFFAKGGERK